MSGWAGRARRAWCSALLGALAWCVLFSISPQAQAQGAVCQHEVMGIPNACLWLKANDDGLTPGSTVSTWQDRSGNEKEMRGVGGPSVVAGSDTEGMNFNPMVRFNGTNQWVKRDDSTIGTAVSEINLFFIFRERQKQQPTPFYHWFGHYSGEIRVSIQWPYFAAGSNRISWDRGICCSVPAGRNQANAPFAMGVANVGLTTYSVTNNRAELVVNARTLDGREPPPDRFSTINLPGDGLTVLGSWYNGDIAELLEFKRHLDATQRTRVQSYLALKYGLTLDRDGLDRGELKDKAYTSGGDKAVYSYSDYWNSIIGIGYDTRTGLDQRVSRSMQKISTDTLWVASGDSPLTLATTPDFSKANNDSSRTPLGAGQYLVLGDNNGDLTLDPATKRLRRVWRAQNTGNVESVYLGFDADKLSDAFPAGGRYYLLVRSNTYSARYALARVRVGDKAVFTPVADIGSATPVPVTIPNDTYIALGQYCDGTALGIADACTWLKANDGVSAGGNWVDQSGMSNTATRNGTTTMTTLNFNPAVSYSGGAGHTLSWWADVTNRYTFLGVARLTGTKNERVFSSAINNRLFGYHGNGQDQWYDESPTGDIYLGWKYPLELAGGRYREHFASGGKNITPAQTRPMLYTLKRADNIASFKSNGRTLLADTAFDAKDGAYRVSLANGGAFATDGEFSDVSVPEFFSFKRALSDAEIDRIESYLALKYGVTLGTAAEPRSYVNSTNQAVWTANRDYQHRVFGLGRDGSGQGLDQRVSKSTDQNPDNSSSSILTLATSPDFASANPGGRQGLGDGQYLVLGDNNGALTFDPATKRLGRVWRAQNTGAVGAVYLGFDTAQFPEGKPGYVLIDATRYPLGHFTQGGADVFTPVASSGSATPVPVPIPNGASITLLEACEGTALGIADACVWLRADRGVSARGDWADQSGMGNTAAVNGTIAMTTLNFNPAVSYSGGAGHTFAVAADVARRYTFLGVARLTGTKNQRVFSAVGNNRLFGYHGDGQNKWYERPATGGDSGLGWKYPPGNDVHERAQTRPMLYTLKRADGIASFKSNGRTLLADAAIDTSGAYRVSLANGGAFAANNESSDVSVPEFFSFKRALSDAEIDRIESYLALKYGFTLGTAAEPKNYVNSENQAVWTANRAYQHRVFGLGRDSHATPNNSTTLDQRVSKSTDHTLDDASSSILTIATSATSADFTSANPGSRTELGAGQYLVLGDNDGALNTLSASAMGRNHNRLPRVWRAQNTGDVRSVFLGLDAAKVKFTDIGRYRLFVESGTGADGSFPASRTSTYVLSNKLPGLTDYWVPVAANGAALAVDIPDGAYLSYGTLAEPQLSLSVQSRGGTGTFGFSGDNGSIASSAITEVEMQPALASPATQTLSAPDVNIVITVAMPATTGWRLESGSCIDRRAAASDNPSGNPSGAVLGRVSASDKFTIPAAQAKASADLHCALVARYDSGSTLKTVSGRVFVDNGVGGGGVANDGHINGAETGRSGAALSLTNCGSGSTTIYAYTSSSGDGRYSLKVPPTAPTSGTMCVTQTLIDDYRVTQGGLEASGLDATRVNVTLDTDSAQSNRWRFTYAGASVQNLHIGNVPSSRLLVDGTRVGIAGSTVDFPHRLIAGTAGTLAFEMSDASPAASGWSEVLYRDANCNAQLDAGEPLLGGSPTAVEANEHVCVIVRQFVPAGLYEGATRQFQLQATLNWANVSARSETLTNRDHTQVSGQALRLYKEVRNVTADERSGTGRESWTTSNSAKPGETLEYRTTFTNLAPEPITKLEIYDATPNYTTLVSAECPAALSLPAGLTCEPLSSTASPPTKPIDGGTGPLRWRFNGPLPGGTSGAVKYRVKVNE